MSCEICTLYPESLWKYFHDICEIPHPSGKEAELVEYMKRFGSNHGLETIIDEIGNVIIKKPATPGMENRKTVCMQGHLDMVPQKNSDKDHDFEKDPIKVIIDGSWVTADGTTLGADNGIGVAAAMAVLTSKEIKHGPIEALFTIDEEAGMTGAFGLKSGYLNADILMNMDSEDEGELYVGCAGGMDTNVKLNFNDDSVPAGMKSYKIEVAGLKGGHSGMDIILGRGNANKILNRILWYGTKDFELRLADIDGGSLRNAIPREAYAVVSVPNEKSAGFEKLVDELKITIQKELATTEPDMKICIGEAKVPEKLIDKNAQDKFVNAIYSCPNGVYAMSADMHGVVETSSNLATIKSVGNSIEIGSLLRSSVDTAKEDLGNMIRAGFELAGADVQHEGHYPGWKPNMSSPILATMKQVYNDKYGKVPEVKVIHAGLECGLIGDVYPNMDLISFGPTIRFPHSPDEKVEIESVGKFWDFLVVTLENIPAK